MQKNERQGSIKTEDGPGSRGRHAGWAKQCATTRGGGLEPVDKGKRPLSACLPQSFRPLDPFLSSQKVHSSRSGSGNSAVEAKFAGVTFCSRERERGQRSYSVTSSNGCRTPRVEIAPSKYLSRRCYGNASHLSSSGLIVNGDQDCAEPWGRPGHFSRKLIVPFSGVRERELGYVDPRKETGDHFSPSMSMFFSTSNGFGLKNEKGGTVLQLPRSRATEYMERVQQKAHEPYGTIAEGKHHDSITPCRVSFRDSSLPYGTGERDTPGIPAASDGFTCRAATHDPHTAASIGLTNRSVKSIPHENSSQNKDTAFRIVRCGDGMAFNRHGLLSVASKRQKDAILAHYIKNTNDIPGDTAHIAEKGSCLRNWSGFCNKTGRRAGRCLKRGYAPADHDIFGVSHRLLHSPYFENAQEKGIEYSLRPLKDSSGAAPFTDSPRGRRNTGGELFKSEILNFRSRKQRLAIQNLRDVNVNSEPLDTGDGNGKRVPDASRSYSRPTAQWNISTMFQPLAAVPPAPQIRARSAAPMAEVMAAGSPTRVPRSVAPYHVLCGGTHTPLASSLPPTPRSQKRHISAPSRAGAGDTVASLMG